MITAKPINGYPSMINKADCRGFIAAKDVEALQGKIIEHSNQPKDKLLEKGEKAKKWLLKQRPYDKLAIEYMQYL
mgnify:CR=1|jgi:hypothetical protein